MATISNPYDPNKEQDKEQGSAAPTVSTAPSESTPAPSGGSSSAPTVNNSAATPKATSSGRFQNIQNYVSANSGYNQGKGLAGQVGDNIQNRASGIQNQFNQAQTDYNKQVQDNTVNYDQNAVNSTLANAGNLSDDQLSTFQKFSNATYGGPTQIAQADQLQSQAGNLATMADKTKSQTGRAGLLQQLYGGSLNTGYNQGQQSLDQLLIQGSPGQLSALQNQTIPLAKNLQSTIGSGLTDAQSVAAQAAATTAATAERTRGALSGALTGFDSDATKAVEQAKIDAEKQYEGLRSRIANKQLTPADYQLMGIQAGEKTYGFDPTQFLRGGTQATKQNVLSSDQAARISGLSRLAGNGFNGEGSEVLKNFSDLSQAGKFSSNPIFDQTGLREIAASQQSKDQKVYNNSLVDDGTGGKFIGQGGTRTTGSLEGDIEALQRAIAAPANSKTITNGNTNTTMNAGTVRQNDLNTLAQLQELLTRKNYSL